MTKNIKNLGKSLGFNDVRISDVDLSAYAPYFRQWVARGFAAQMDYMVRHGDKRLKPSKLIPGTVRAIVVRMDYSPPGRDLSFVRSSQTQAQIGLIARYTLGRDYHKVVKKRLETFKEKIYQLVDFSSVDLRAFVDSAPVLEKPLAEKAGIGWQGKNGLIISKTGSWFFLGSLLTNLPLEIDSPVENKCNSCKACFRVCPTNAIIADKQIDTKRCISYLTIENKGVIEEELRPLIGNRIFGCDDCQMICPWNRWSYTTVEKDFFARRGLESPALSDLAFLSKDKFLKIFQGSAVLRVGYEGFLRNVAIALGNSIKTQVNCSALNHLSQSDSKLISIHARWALKQIGRTPYE